MIQKGTVEISEGLQDDVIEPLFASAAGGLSNFIPEHKTPDIQEEP
jgi:hypothetical protein